MDIGKIKRVGGMTDVNDYASSEIEIILVQGAEGERKKEKTRRKTKRKKEMVRTEGKGKERKGK